MEFEELIGSGRVLKIYRKDDWVFKVYLIDYLIFWIEKEYNILNILKENINLILGNLIFYKKEYVLEMFYI